MVFHRFDSGWEWFFALFSAPASGDFCGGRDRSFLGLSALNLAGGCNRTNAKTANKATASGERSQLICYYLSFTTVFFDSDFSCPQAAKMSRPRGVRIGAGRPYSSK